LDRVGVHVVLSKDALITIKAASWTLTCGLCWLCASRGYTSWGRFDVWFWGIAFWADLVIFGIAVSALIVEPQ
jgi:hypothetical protein